LLTDREFELYKNLECGYCFEASEKDGVYSMASIGLVRLGFAQIDQGYRETARLTPLGKNFLRRERAMRNPVGRFFYRILAV